MSRFWEPYILGVLPDESDLLGHRRSIFINSSNDLQFSIKILSTPPHSFPNSQKTVTCWGVELERHGFEDEYFEKERRINSLSEFLSGKLLVFQVEKNITPRNEYYVAKNIQLIPKKLSFTENQSFFPIPLFIENNPLLNTEGYSWDEFKSHLIKGSYLGRNDNVSNEPEDTPRFIFYETSEGDSFAIGEFENHHYAHGGFSFVTEGKIVSYKQIDKKIMNNIYRYENVMFVGLDEENDIMNELANGEPIITTPDIQMNESQITIENKNEVKRETPNQLIEGKHNEVTSIEKEEAFMNQFILETKRMNLNYYLEDLYNFHISIKSGGLTILAGMSGTGKSQLVQAYQRGLHLSTDNFLMVPVSPTWTDDSDLLGYPDIINNVYRPSETGVVNLLIEASRKHSETFIICFDEMNLAKVEHYFSQFLSVLEMEKGRRKLKLYNRDLENKFYNGSYYPHEILIGENVIFTGTVNLDESTHLFSDKVLDRANLITLHVEPFSKLLEKEKGLNEKIEHKQKEMFSVHSFIRQDKQMILSKEELEMLWEVHESLRAISVNMGVGPRIVRQIDNYIKNISNLPNCPIDRRRGFDLQFVQRVMSKIRGSEEMLHHFIGTYHPESNIVTDSQLLEILDKYAEHSDFTKSRALILEKAKELKRNGYTF